MSDEKHIEAVANGKKASFLLIELRPVLDKVRTATIERLKGQYRSAKYTEASMLAGLAELCTLDDIENSLKTTMSLGDAANKRMIENERD